MNPIDLGDLNDYRYFAVVAERGGFSAAARALALPKSRLSRRVAGLEARLGVRLLQRSTRRLTLTDVGRQVLAHAQNLLREAEAAACVATRQVMEVSGRVRLSLPAAVLEPGLRATLTAFLARHPAVQLDLVITGRRIDLIEEGIDVALRVRAPEDEDPAWATRRLRRTAGRLVASPDLVARLGGLATVEAVAEAPALGAAGPDHRVRWRLQGPGGVGREIAAPARMACEDFVLRREAALAGLGVTMLPDELIAADLDAGRLLPVLPNWQLPSGHLQAVYATQRGLSPAVRALLDALAALEGPAAA
jgi:DNA-binding transcriptional LysR family regulator